MYTLKVLKHKLWMKVIGLVLRLLKSPRPMVLVGEDSSVRLAKLVASKGAKHVLLVTDRDLVNLGLHEKCHRTLAAAGVEVTVHSNISPNPTIEQIEEGVSLGKRAGCDTVFALGGGSPIDAGKIISARLTNDVTTESLEGFLKVKNKPLPFYAVPTTAGTGSEVTQGAIVTNTQQQRKYSIGDAKLVPLATALDPVLMRGLPPTVTAATGMDALTHAIEAYVVTFATSEVRENASIAVKLIFDNLREAYNNGENLEAREAMAVAAYHGGMAITDAGVGYVHAMAHQLGGIYHVPHGLANAVLLPHVLDFSKNHVTRQLAELARLIGLEGSGEVDLAEGFIREIRKLNRDLGLPATLPEIQSRDIPRIVDRAIEEAFAASGVPCYMRPAQGAEILRALSAS